MSLSVDIITPQTPSLDTTLPTCGTLCRTPGHGSAAVHVALQIWGASVTLSPKFHFGARGASPKGITNLHFFAFLPMVCSSARPRLDMFVSAQGNAPLHACVLGINPGGAKECGAKAGRDHVHMLFS